MYVCIHAYVPAATGADKADGELRLLLLLFLPRDGNVSWPSEGKASADGGPCFDIDAG
jgi:hypothetical protein